MNKPPVTTNLLGRRATYDETREVAHIDADVSRVGQSGSVVALRENQRSLLVMIQFDDGHAQELPVENLKFEDPDQSFHHTVANLLQRAVGHAEVLLDGTELPTEVEGGLANWLKDVRALTGTTGARPEHAVDWGRCALEAAELGRSIDVLENLSNFRKLVELASHATTPPTQAPLLPREIISRHRLEIKWKDHQCHVAPVDGSRRSASGDSLHHALVAWLGERHMDFHGPYLHGGDDPIGNAIQEHKLEVRWPSVDGYGRCEVSRRVNAESWAGAPGASLEEAVERWLTAQDLDRKST